jgi:rfaE bifunctional protein nucleotidyltransferase chain/domain
LVVGLNSDQSVRALKGPTRPLQPELDRALVLASLQFVDYVVIFEEVRAVNFLAKVRPDVYVKGGDYTLDTLDPGERQVLEEARAKIHFIPVNPGKSTTQLVQKIVSAHVG